jgi:GTPase Era involved in 16S rRNA processing
MVNAKDRYMLEQIKDADFSNADFAKNYEEIAKYETQESFPMPSVLIMNKVDLVSNRRKFNYLKQELQDIGGFEETFHISAKTGYGVEEFVDYLCSIAKRGDWLMHEEMDMNENEIQKCQLF